MRNQISFYLNGVLKKISAEQAFLPLSSYLRYESQLTGTKVVCAEGDCGACTVMVSKWNPNGIQNYHSINSCIAMTFALDGCSIVTVEGLSKNTTELNEVQCSMVRNFGGQCGFCTPGFVMSICNLHENKVNPDEQNVKNYLTGNLCRCTGYEPIIKSALDVDLNKHEKIQNLYKINHNLALNSESLLVNSGECELFAPLTIQEACLYKKNNPNAVVFAGSTDLGVQFNKGKLRPEKILSLHLIQSLYDKSIHNNKVNIGARVSIHEFQKLIESKIPSLDRYINIFASPQIKNSATLIGNLVNASPIADMTPALMSLDAELNLVGVNSTRVVSLKDFYLDYKKIDLKSDEIVTQLSFLMPDLNSKYENYKVSQRRDLDISTVNASFNFTIENKIIKKARISYGGVAATTIRLEKAEQLALNKNLNQELKIELLDQIDNLITPLSDLRGSAQFRKVIVKNLFEKFCNEQLGL